MRENVALALSPLLRREDALHFLGYPEGHHPSERVERRLEELLEEARGLARARGAFRRLPVSDAQEIGLAPMDASGLVIGLVTAGPGIEERVSELLARGDSLSALLMDAIGSAAAEEAADLLGALAVGEEAGLRRGASISCRISPGYGEWLLSAQPALFARLPHQEMGIRLLPSLLMVPRKSISFAMWLGADARPLAGLSGCSRCPLEHCRYRRESPEEGPSS